VLQAIKDIGRFESLVTARVRVWQQLGLGLGDG
jgi:hypothetical protein